MLQTLRLPPGLVKFCEMSSGIGLCGLDTGALAFSKKNELLDCSPDGRHQQSLLTPNQSLILRPRPATLLNDEMPLTF